MIEELYDLIKIQSQSNNAQAQDEVSSCVPLLNATNIKIVSTQIVDAMCKELQDKEKSSKANLYVKLIKHICKKHERIQCLNINNLDVYLKSLPISNENECDKELFLPETDKIQEINHFYRQRTAKHNEIQKHKEKINFRVQKTFFDGFDYIPRKELQVELFKLEITCDKEDEEKKLEDEFTNKHNADESIKARNETSKFALAVINLRPGNANFLLRNVTEKLTKYEDLQRIELEFLALLYKQSETIGFDKVELLEQFPILLEQRIINFATKYMQGNLSAAEIANEKLHVSDFIDNNELIRCKAVSICYELFSLSNYHYDLLDKLLNLVQ